MSHLPNHSRAIDLARMHGNEIPLKYQVQPYKSPNLTQHYPKPLGRASTDENRRNRLSRLNLHDRDETGRLDVVPK